jgi:hypothetical protein
MDSNDVRHHGIVGGGKDAFSYGYFIEFPYVCARMHPASIRPTHHP